MVSRAKVYKYREVFSKQSQVQVGKMLKSQTETHEQVVRKLPRSTSDMQVCAWREFQAVNTTESRPAVATILGGFTVRCDFDRTREDVLTGTLILGN